MEEKCNLWARSEMSSATVVGIRGRNAAAAITQPKTHNPTLRMWRMESPQIVRTNGESLPYQPAKQRLFPCLAIYFRERFRQRNFLGARFHAILSVGAIFNPAVSHRSAQPLFGVHRAGGMHIEQAHLVENCCAHEVTVLV